MAADGVVCALIDTNQKAPFIPLVKPVVHDLAIGKLSLLFENFLWGSCVVDISMVDVCFTYYTKFVFTDPSPEPDWLVDLAMLELCFRVKVEDLYARYNIIVLLT